ncbi:MAG: helix-turn-helix transcriptional regulator [Planctomycetota bacterium]|nr:helix-turn-helix transcriptional regulator [Planctomycetota bacterium]
MKPLTGLPKGTYSKYAAPRPEDLARLSITSVGSYRVDRRAYKCSRLNGHPAQHMLYVLKGSADGVIAGKPSHCEPGSLWFTRKDRPYEYWLAPDCDDWQGYWIEYDGPWAEHLWAMTGLSDVVHVPGCFEARPVVEELHRAVMTGSAAGTHEATALLWRLFSVAEANLAGVRTRSDTVQAAIDRVQRFVRERLEAPVGLPDMAKVAGLSAFHFARVFRQRTGFSPAAYVRTVRMSKAQELLRRGDLNVKQVGQAVGYPTVQHFSAVFKQTTGLSPRAFLRAHRA